MQCIQDFRHFHRVDLLWKHSDSAESARLANVELALLRGVHHHRNRGRRGVFFDRFQRLETIHPRHQMIHENDVRSRVPKVLQRLLPGGSRIDRERLLGQHAAEHESGRC